MTIPYPYFYCPGCRNRIAFPIPTQQEPTGYRHRLPTEMWKIVFLCTRCVKMFAVSAQDLRMGAPDTDTRNPGSVFSPTWYQVDTRCGYTGCGIRKRIFAHSTTFLPEANIVESFRAARPRPFCSEIPKKHVLSGDADILGVREVWDIHAEFHRG
jgi:hypothetical protein